MTGLLDGLILRSARKSHDAIRPHVIGPTVLDIGAAEGWVGMYLSESGSLNVQLLDVVDLCRVPLPHRVYEGTRIPFGDDSFDTTLILLTLHHCQDPERVLGEAIRVTRRRLIVTESVYRLEAGRWLLWSMDTVVNSLRSRRLMAEAVHFRRIRQWRALFRSHGLDLAHGRYLSRGLHRHALFVLDLPQKSGEKTGRHRKSFTTVKGTTGQG